MRRFLLTAVAVGAAALVAATTALAQRTADTLTCGDATYSITVTSQPSDHSVGWGIGTISGGDHFIPTAFSGEAIDLTTGETLFSFTQSKGQGNGMHTQTQVTCSTPTELGTAGELGVPGVDPADEIALTFSATVVRKP